MVGSGSRRKGAHAGFKVVRAARRHRPRPPAEQTSAARGGRDLLAPLFGSFTADFDTPDLKDAKAMLDALDASRLSFWPQNLVRSEGPELAPRERT
jgi:hypothetical protein